MSTPIQDGETQYIVYQNSFLRGICKSKDSVLVSWGSGFVQSVTAETWNKREFLEKGEKARAVVGEDVAKAQAYFASQMEEHKRTRTLK
jgi:hypothetical protein